MNALTKIPASVARPVAGEEATNAAIATMLRSYARLDDGQALAMVSRLLERFSYSWQHNAIHDALEHLAVDVAYEVGHQAAAGIIAADDMLERHGARIKAVAQTVEARRG